MKINSKYIYMSLIMLPRTALAYPLYALASFMMAIDKSKFGSTLAYCFFWLLFCTLQIFLLSLYYEASYINMLLDFAQILPFFMILLAPFSGWKIETRLIINLNYIVFSASILNLVINYNFPLKLPYIDYLPDAISAFWSSGGAKITTICGFMGILSLKKNTHERNKYIWSVAIFNFIAPSYNIGIFCGLIPIAYLMLREISFKNLLRLIIIGMIAILSIVPYIIKRLNELSSVFYEEFGAFPKIYAIKLNMQLLATDPLVFLFGGGLGNIAGTSALWANESLSKISLNSAPNIPGMFEAELHTKILGPALEIAEKYPWAISSSLNKPYFTFSTLIFEFGIVLGSILIYLFFKSIKRGGISRPYNIAIFIFFILIFTLDNLHANPLFWFVILTGIRALVETEQSKNKILYKGLS